MTDNIHKTEKENKKIKELQERGREIGLREITQ